MAFDEADEAIATIIANHIVAAMEIMELSEASRELLRRGLDGSTRKEFLAELLSRSLILLKADRGDVCWADKDGELQMIPKAGPCDLRDDRSAKKSICTQVFKTMQPYLAQNLRDQQAHPEYQCCCARTESEIAVPLFLPPLSGEGADHRSEQ